MPFSLVWNVFICVINVISVRYSVSLRIQSECGKMREKFRPEQLLIRTLFTQCKTYEKWTLSTRIFTAIQ